MIPILPFCQNKCSKVCTKMQIGKFDSEAISILQKGIPFKRQGLGLRKNGAFIFCQLYNITIDVSYSGGAFIPTSICNYAAGNSYVS